MLKLVFGVPIKCYESTSTFSAQVVKYVLVEFFDMCVEATSCFQVNVTSRANCCVFELSILKFFLSFKSTQVKTILPWWANTISPIFFQILCNFQIYWEMDRNHQKNPFLPMCKVTLVQFEASVMIRKPKNRHFFTFPRYLWAPWSTNPA